MFGPAGQWPEQDLIAFSEQFDAQLALAGYLEGIFPMPLQSIDPAPDMGWWSPLERGILPLDGLRVTRSLRKSASHLATTIDRDFEQVLQRCADPGRPGGWIDARIRAAFIRLHQVGVAHSVEVWDAQGRLVGGLYGVSIGGLFAGESMFHDPEHGRDASKVALLRLTAELRAGVPEGELATQRLLDVQWVTDHLRTLGAVEIPRAEYLRRLERVISATPVVWPAEQGSRRSGRASLPAAPSTREPEVPDARTA